MWLSWSELFTDSPHIHLQPRLPPSCNRTRLLCDEILLATVRPLNRYPPITASPSVVDGHSGSRVAAFLLTVCSVFGSNGPCDAGLRVAMSALPQELMGAHRQCIQEVLKALL